MWVVVYISHEFKMQLCMHICKIVLSERYRVLKTWSLKVPWRNSSKSEYLLDVHLNLYLFQLIQEFMSSNR